MFDVFNKADVTVKLPKANEIDYRNAEKSVSVPFLIAPTNLKGLPGYKSFDPWFFSNTLDVKWLQEAGQFKLIYTLYNSNVFYVYDIHIVIHHFMIYYMHYFIEIKHARIAMLATVGYVATEFIHLPGAVYSVSPIAAHDAAVASG